MPVIVCCLKNHLPKKDFLKAFGAQIFFDDQTVHTSLAAEVVPAARVPVSRGEKSNIYRLERKMNEVS